MPTSTGGHTEAPPALSKYLEVNIPRIGVVSALMFFPEAPSTNKPGSMKPAAFGFKGLWETPTGPVEGMVFIDQHKLDTDLIATGFAQRGPDYQGQARFEWLEKGRVQLLLRLLPQNKRVAYITRADAPMIPVASQPMRSATPVIASEPATPEAVMAATDPWASIERQYERARFIACRIWGDNYDPTALVAAAATVFIESNKRGMKL